MRQADNYREREREREKRMILYHCGKNMQWLIIASMRQADDYSERERERERETERERESIVCNVFIYNPL
jgi:hypothetical protein